MRFELQIKSNQEREKMTAPAAPVCYLRGTRIATPNGEREIEDLHIGDEVLTASGAIRPIKWIGRMFYPKSRREWQRRVLPVLIAKGALGNALPKRDLLVSQAHMMLIDGVLIEARFLLNGGSIRISDQTTASELVFYHIELSSHDALLAEGQPAETLRANCRHREKFANFGEYLRLYPNEGRAMPKPFAPVHKPSLLVRLVQALGLEGQVSTDANASLLEKTNV